MIATWMLYCSLCALGLAAAAALAERMLLAGRGSVRFLWMVAVVLSLLVPATALRSRSVPAPVGGSAATHELSAAANPTFTVPPQQFSPVSEPQPESPRRDRSAALARLDAPLAIAWITLSLAVLFDFLGGIMVLAWMRRRWQQRTVLDVPVLVSERTGPAVVGTVKPEIVVPEWVLALEPAQLELMLRHEQEHKRAGDGRLIAAAKLALIVMPWNIALWWQILRLRAAVELDCDARVLQNADARSYGDLLLEMARPRRGPRLFGATAFAERATQLERRIRVLGRHCTRTSRRARALATAIGLVALTVAWVAPHPAVPASEFAPPVAEKPVERNVLPPSAPVSNPDAPVPTAMPAARPPATQNEERKPAVVTPTPRELATLPNLPAQPLVTLPPCARAGGPEVAAIVDDVFNRVFEGIALTERQEQQACAILIMLHGRQSANDEAISLAMSANQARRVQRDAALRALLTNEADRAAFDSHLATQAAGARGGRGGGGGGGGGRARSGGAGADTVAGGARGGRRVGGVMVLDSMRVVLSGEGAARSGGEGGGGRGGRGAPRGGGAGVLNDSMMAAMTAMSNEATLRRLFADISLTTGQESRARELIANHQQEVQAQRPPRSEVILRVNPNTGAISMQAEGVNELLALVASDADRTKVQSRVTAVPAVQR